MYVPSPWRGQAADHSQGPGAVFAGELPLGYRDANDLVVGLVIC